MHHLPSDELCHKILMSSVDEKEKEVVLQKRSKCLTVIQEVRLTVFVDTLDNFREFHLWQTDGLSEERAFLCENC